MCNNSTVQPSYWLLLYCAYLKDSAAGFKVAVDGKDYVSVFVLSGEEWRKRRHSISPAFSTYKMRLVSTRSEWCHYPPLLIGVVLYYSICRKNKFGVCVYHFVLFSQISFRWSLLSRRVQYVWQRRYLY